MTNGNDLIQQERETFGNTTLHEGLTKREYFAAMAMQGWVAGGYMTNSVDGRALAAERSVIHADALIEALNKETK